jgi:hypothetical protein
VLIALTVAALVAGLAGAWSPCGFSMVDTLAPGGYAQRMRVTVAACAAFALGALAGGAVTFGGLALLGHTLGAGGGAAAALAVAVLLSAAAGDIGGRRIVPQIRRQVPESWRRVMPIAVAAALYGVLLGLGFTTFVLSYAVYALAAACLALGDPATGLAVGLAFAVGRIVPVVVLAPAQGSERGVLLAGMMGEKPGVLRAIRATGALALGAAAVVLALHGAAATAAEQVTADGTDPSTNGTTLVWQLPKGGASMILHPGGQPQPLPGADPAIGPLTVVWREGEQLVVARADTLQVLRRVAAPGAEEPAISNRWLVWRAFVGGRDVMFALDLAQPGKPAESIRVVSPPGRLGRPSLDGDRVVYHLARRAYSLIEETFLPTRHRTVLRRAHNGALLLNPSLSNGALLYVSSSLDRQELLFGSRRGRFDKRLFAMAPTIRRDLGRDPGHHNHVAGYPSGRPRKLPKRAPKGIELTLWSTALDAGHAYVSRTRRASGATTSEILRFPR